MLTTARYDNLVRSFVRFKVSLICCCSLPLIAYCSYTLIRFDGFNPLRVQRKPCFIFYFFLCWARYRSILSTELLLIGRE